jgi:hypothetical protein
MIPQDYSRVCVSAQNISMLIYFLFPKDEAALTNTTEENVIIISDTEDFPVAQNINDFCNIVEQRTFEFSIHATSEADDSTCAAYRPVYIPR